MKKVTEKTEIIKQSIARRILMFQMAVMGLLMPMQVGATNKLMETDLYKGAMALIKDGLIVLTVSCGVITAFLVGLEASKYRMADDQAKPAHKKNIKTILVTGVVIVGIEALVTAFFSYFTPVQ